MSKLTFIIVATVFFTPLLAFVNKYIFNDWEYAVYLGIAMAVDTVLGFCKHYKNKSLSSSACGKILYKMISYGSILIIVHILTHFTVDSEQIKFFSWMETIAYAALLVKEGISVMENVGAINPRFVPTVILKRLKDFDETGKFKKDENHT